MGSLLIFDRDPMERRFVAALANGRYQPVIEAGEMNVAAKAMGNKRHRPELIVLALDLKHQDALLLLRALHSSHSNIPVVVIARGSARGLESTARSLGARVFVHNPADAREMQSALQQAVDAKPHAPTIEPPVTTEESSQNLSVLVNRLNETIECYAGSGQVFLHSFIEFGQKARPRVCLRCPIRVSLGLPEYVYYEHIRDFCCKAPGQCEARRRYQAENR